MFSIEIGMYSCLKVNLLFKREFSYYLIQIYVPCCMLVIVSWVSFWLDANAVPARVSLGVTTLLTMATQTTGINNSLPPVSYTKVFIDSIIDLTAIIHFFCADFCAGYWRVDGRLFDVRVQRPAGVCPGQLRVAIGCPHRKNHQTASTVGDGTRTRTRTASLHGTNCQHGRRQPFRWRLFGLSLGKHWSRL